MTDTNCPVCRQEITENKNESEPVYFAKNTCLAVHIDCLEVSPEFFLCINCGEYSKGKICLNCGEGENPFDKIQEESDPAKDLYGKDIVIVELLTVDKEGKEKYYDTLDFYDPNDFFKKLSEYKVIRFGLRPEVPEFYAIIEV